MGDQDGSKDALPMSLFQGMQFWLSQNIPQRTRFKELIQKNGGIIRLQEKDADIKLVDHLRKNLPADTYSYKFVEVSLAKGELQDIESFRAGPSAPRPVGASYIPTRGHKVYYTLEDDQTLWDWMQPYERDPKASIRGNKIYQELAEQNPRHTYQSYRDRYLKKLKGLPRPGGMPASSDPPPASQGEPVINPPARTAQPQSREKPPSGSAADNPGERKRKRTSEHNIGGEGEQKEAAPSNPKKKAIVINELADPFTTRIQTGEAATTQDMPLPAGTTNAQNQNINEANSKKQGDPDARHPAHQSQDPSQIDPMFLELPFLPLDDEPEQDDPEDVPQQDLDTLIEDRLRAGKADNQSQILEALKCTSMDPDVADKVLAYLVAGKDIPDDMPGVWTPEDDRAVEGTDARAIKRVIEKHGADAYNSRWEYLSMARDAGLVGTHE